MITSTLYGILYSFVLHIRTIHTYILLLNAMNDPVVEHNEDNFMPETVHGERPID